VAGRPGNSNCGIGSHGNSTPYIRGLFLYDYNISGGTNLLVHSAVSPGSFANVNTSNILGAASCERCTNVYVSTSELPPPPPCYCYEFFNSGTTLAKIRFEDCNGKIIKKSILGTKKYCARTVVSASSNVIYSFTYNCLLVQENPDVYRCPPNTDSIFNGMVAINDQGYLISDFMKNMEDGFNGSVNVIKQYNTSSIIVGGNFTTYAGFTARGIIILNTDGTIYNNLEGGFNLSAGTPNVTGIEILPDNSIIIVGDNLGTFGKQSIPANIVKLNSRSVVDT
jgi:hypothetical protein